MKENNYVELLVKADRDEVFAINNKDITAPEIYEDIAVKGDENSNSLIFKINRVLDGVDISDKTIQIFYINADGYSDIVPAASMYITEDYILFSWLLDNNVTAAVGSVSFIVKISGLSYIWKSKPCYVTIAETLDDTVITPVYTSAWVTSVEKRLSELEGGISVIRQINYHNDRITTLENTVENDSARITALENNVVIDYSTVYVGVNNKVPNFSTVTQALECAQQHSEDYDEFNIYINAGTYNEQVYVDLPNVHLHSYTGNKDVKITWYYGIGYTYYSADAVTGRYNKTAASSKTELSPVSNWGGTVIVTGSADNFTAENIIFENSFNKRVTEREIIDGVTADTAAYTDTSIILDRTADDFIATSRAATERASAMVIYADKTEFDNCDFIGSQDTLYFGAASSNTSNRGYFANCSVWGMTDFIFGHGNVIFNKCSLNFCGYSDLVNEYAFITANKNADKGFLFNRCTVDYDTAINGNAPDGLNYGKGYYLGRTWGVGAKTTFLRTIYNNINIFSPEFWFEMNGTLEEANYTEARSYDGSTRIMLSSITNAVRASKYADDFSFTCEDWFGDWVPVNFEEQYSDIYYDFQCNNEGAYNQSLEGAVGTWNGLSINAQSGKLAANTGANCTQMNMGTVITISVQGECTVTVTAYSGQGNGNLILSQGDNNVTADSDVLIFNAVKGDVVLTAIENTYINSIAVFYE